MRIAFVTHISNLYGANRSLMALLSQRDRIDIEPMVFTPQAGEFTEWLEGEEIAHAVAPVPWWASPSLPQTQADPSAPYQVAAQVLLAELSDQKIDLVHTNSAVTPVGFYLSRALAVPHVWHLREFGTEDWGLQWHHGLAHVRALIAKSDRSIAISHAIANHYQSDAKQIPQVIYNGIGTRKEFAERSRASAHKAATFQFVLTGHLNPNKGQILAIKAFARTVSSSELPMQLVLVGGGDPAYRAQCEALADRLGVAGQVQFFGHAQEPLSIVARSHVALMCSTFEGMGRVTAEAMSCGVPVIGTDSGGTPEVISHGKNGFLFPSNGGEEAVEKLAAYMSLLAHDPELRKRLGAQAFQDAADRFTDERYASNIDVLYQALRREDASFSS